MGNLWLKEFEGQGRCQRGPGSGQWRSREKHRPCPVPSVQRQGDELESSRSPEPFETEASEV